MISTAVGDDRSPGRVLLVDDDAATRRLLQELLHERGFEVVTASSGAEGIDKAARIEPEVILLDIRMPELDGIATCNKLKSHAETADIPVLFITGFEDDVASIVEALSVGGNDFVTKDASAPVLAARVNSQVSIYRHQSRVKRMAMVDELTGVYTRRFLFHSMREAIKATSRRAPAGLGCLLADVDHFREINDNQGHLEGDRMLRRIAATIEKTMRETDRVARFGGEEFVILLPATDLRGAVIAGEKVRNAIERECAPVTVSVGVAYLPPTTGEDLRQTEGIDRLVAALLRQADNAMYTAKERGRNRTVAAERAIDIAAMLAGQE